MREDVAKVDKFVEQIEQRSFLRAVAAVDDATSFLGTLDQPFALDDSKTVEAAIKELGEGAEIVAFKRVAVG